MLDLGRTLLQELEKWRCRSKLANYKRPRDFVFVKVIPKSPVGKLLRRKSIAVEFEPDPGNGMPCIEGHPND